MNLTRSIGYEGKLLTITPVPTNRIPLVDEVTGDGIIIIRDI